MKQLFPGDLARARVLRWAAILCFFLMPDDSDENIHGAVLVWRWSLAGLLLSTIASFLGRIRRKKRAIPELVSIFANIGADITIFGIAAACAIALCVVKESRMLWFFLVFMFARLSLGALRRIRLRGRQIARLYRFQDD